MCFFLRTQNIYLECRFNLWRWSLGVYAVHFTASLAQIHLMKSTHTHTHSCIIYISIDTVPMRDHTLWNDLTEAALYTPHVRKFIYRIDTHICTVPLFELLRGGWRRHWRSPSKPTNTHISSYHIPRMPKAYTIMQWGSRCFFKSGYLGLPYVGFRRYMWHCHVWRIECSNMGAKREKKFIREIVRKKSPPIDRFQCICTYIRIYCASRTIYNVCILFFRL